MPITGHCLCGNVKITVPDQEAQVLCHCTDCQHTSGSSHSTNILVEDSEIKLEGKVATYESKAASGNTVTRTFCPNCGSPISHKSPAFKTQTAVQTGNLLESFKEKPIAAELFVKDRWKGFKAIEGANQVNAM